VRAIRSSDLVGKQRVSKEYNMDGMEGPDNDMHGNAMKLLLARDVENREAGETDQ
jgi:hypothetical protein